MLGENVKREVPTARKIRLHRTVHKGQVTYDLLNCMNVLRYVDWITNPENEYNCDRCKHNVDSTNNLPCGQQNCWVTFHIS